MTLRQYFRQFRTLANEDNPSAIFTRDVAQVPGHLRLHGARRGRVRCLPSKPRLLYRISKSATTSKVRAILYAAVYRLVAEHEVVMAWSSRGPLFQDRFNDAVTQKPAEVSRKFAAQDNTDATVRVVRVSG